MFRVACLLILCLPGLTFGDQIWVDQQSGDDSANGGINAPLQTVNAALQRVTPGSVIRLVPGKKPWPGEIRITASGLPNKPIVFDGQGSIVSNRRKIAPGEWKSEGDNVYSRSLPNNAWGMEHCWEGEFPLVWFNGTAGVNYTSREELQPLGFFLYKNRAEAKTDPLHNTLFVRLPEGKTLENITIESIAGEGGIFVGGDHVYVVNVICEYGGRDGFATHKNKEVFFHNVEARYFMDQGMSHHGATVSVSRGWFHHNAGAGIVDVYPECRVHYEFCVIENNPYRGGVEFHSGQFSMRNCIIRNNARNGVVVTKDATAFLVNCRIEGSDEIKGTGITVHEGSPFGAEHCTIQDFESGMSIFRSQRSNFKLSHCVIAGCPTTYKMKYLHDGGDNDPTLKTWTERNLFEMGEIEMIHQHPGGGGGFFTAKRRYDLDDWKSFAEEYLDHNSNARKLIRPHKGHHYIEVDGKKFPVGFMAPGDVPHEWLHPQSK